MKSLETVVESEQKLLSHKLAISGWLGRPGILPIDGMGGIAN